MIVQSPNHLKQTRFIFSYTYTHLFKDSEVKSVIYFAKIKISPIYLHFIDRLILEVNMGTISAFSAFPNKP